MVLLALVLPALLALGGCAAGGASGGGGGGSGGYAGGPNPVPSIVFLDPSSVAMGGPDFYLTVYGSGFSPSSVVQWNGSTLATTFVSGTLAYAVVSASYRSASSTASVAVFNPTPGGGLSNALPVFIGPVPQPPAGIGVIQLVSAAPAGTPGNGHTYTPPAVSADGRYVAFQSDSTNLVPGPASGFTDIYLRDTCIGAATGCTPTTTRISVGNDGSLPNGNSRSPAISASGRYVAFDSSAAKVSVAVDGSHSNAPAYCSSISADMRYISFSAESTNLIPNDPRASAVLHDTCFGAPVGCTPSNQSLFVGYAGTPPTAGFSRWVLSTNARFSGFDAETNYLVPGDSGQMVGAFVYDDCIGAPAGCIPHTDRLSVTYIVGQADSGSIEAVSSNDGNYVAFISVADHLLSYSCSSSAVYVRLTCANFPTSCVPTTYLLSVDSNTGIQGNSQFSDSPAITPDGRYVVFISTAANWPGSLQSNGNHQVWLARVH